jgi:pimeloyl-ACP methyl ester carboxylesterase
MQLTFEYWNRTNSPNDALTHFIFLHGMGGTGKLWRPIAASLESEFGIWAPDQRGHGGSRPVTDDDYSVESFGKDVCDFMEAQKLKPEDCFLVGHSMGVRTTASAAAQLPLRIRGIVLIDLGFSGPAGGGLGEVLSSFLSKLPTRFESRAAARDFMEAEAPDPSMGQYLMATGRPTSDGAFEFPFDPESLIATQKKRDDQRHSPPFA